jgi:tRNA(Ile)-lysidine synthase
MVPDGHLAARFAADLDRLSPANERIGVAVSGGPDSLALLLLAAAVRPGRVEAITVDHALRAESRAEAEQVAVVCAGLGVTHEIRTVAWAETPDSAIQERAREARYRLIADWLRERRLCAVCTAHHRDDQAETLLMRLMRGAGVRGLAAIRPASPLPGAPHLRLLRPLIDWPRSELVEVCAAAGVEPAADPSNEDCQFERVRVRQQIAALNLDAEALARSADHLRAADEAIGWAVEREWQARVSQSDDRLDYDPGDAPAEIRRRIVGRIIATLAGEGDGELRGRELDRLLDALESGTVATLRGVRAQGGPCWQFRPAPPRSLACG